MDDNNKKQRKKMVEDAFIIASSSNEKPNQDALNVAQLYIDGKINLNEMKSEILSIYKKGGDV